MILVLNAGSSSLKYRLVDLADRTAGRGGGVERIGAPGGPADHRAALAVIAGELALDRDPPRAIGHRVVHGGDRFREPVLVTDEVVRAIGELGPLAPLHNPANLTGIQTARAWLPEVPQVAVFDTAFHATLPAAAATYAVDAGLAARHGIRRYGFHGTAGEQVVHDTAALLDRPVTGLYLIVLHLGNGASATAVAGGRSVETSMGLSPLEGLVMGTRSGDLDPAVAGYLRRLGLDGDEVDDLLWHRGGLLGLCGDSDMRAVLARRDAADPAARLAVAVYCHRIRKYVGAYHAVLGRLDAIVFTAGVGEHAAAIRAEALAGLDHWGIRVDPARNRAAATDSRLISPPAAPVAVCVVPADEAWAIARATGALLAQPR